MENKTWLWKWNCLVKHIGEMQRKRENFRETNAKRKQMQ